MFGPPGPDALRRRAAKADREREERRRAIEKYGPDPGQLEYPCAWCGEHHEPGKCENPDEHEA